MPGKGDAGRRQRVLLVMSTNALDLCSNWSRAQSSASGAGKSRISGSSAEGSSMSGCTGVDASAALVPCAQEARMAAANGTSGYNGRLAGDLGSEAESLVVSALPRGPYHSGESKRVGGIIVFASCPASESLSVTSSGISGSESEVA